MRGLIELRRDSHIGIVLLIIFSALLSALSVSAASMLTPTPKAYLNAQKVDVGAISANTPNGTTFACQAPSAPVRCYNPDQIRKAYDVTPLLDSGITGASRTIVIIDAYQSPTLISDLKLFDKVFGLPDPKLNIIAPYGLTPFDYNDPNQVGWSGEISLDVEWSHAIAPGATIDLVLAPTNNDPDLLKVTQYVVDNDLGDVISQSFGEGEACSGVPLDAEHAVFEAATDKHMTIFASSGDQGAAQGSQTTPVACGGSNPFYKSASTPASDPLVTGVGATYLNATANGSYIGEAAWNDRFGASGGGYSTVYNRPHFQHDVVKGNWRGVPDVSYNGDVNGGVLTVWTSYAANAVPHIWTFGGTSAGSPQWAGITALADQQAGTRLGLLNHAIYNIGRGDDYHWAFHDITAGNNTYQTTDASGNPLTISGYDTTKGWDAVTGWGSPDVAHLLLPLIKEVKYLNGA